MLNLTGVDLMSVLDEVISLVPVVLPAIIGFIGLRKGLQFVKSALKGA